LDIWPRRDMPDILIRDIPPEDVAAVERHAAAEGISRAEYLRRIIHSEAARTASQVTVADFARFSALGSDLADDEVRKKAWS
jgi:hypothetical protein